MNISLERLWNAGRFKWAADGVCGDEPAVPPHVAACGPLLALMLPMIKWRHDEQGQHGESRLPVPTLAHCGLMRRRLARARQTSNILRLRPRVQTARRGTRADHFPPRETDLTTCAALHAS